MVIDSILYAILSIHSILPMICSGMSQAAQGRQSAFKGADGASTQPGGRAAADAKTDADADAGGERRPFAATDEGACSSRRARERAR